MSWARRVVKTWGPFRLELRQLDARWDEIGSGDRLLLLGRLSDRRLQVRVWTYEAHLWWREPRDMETTVRDVMGDAYLERMQTQLRDAAERYRAESGET